VREAGNEINEQTKASGSEEIYSTDQNTKQSLYVGIPARGIKTLQAI